MDVVELVIQERIECGDVLFRHRVEPLTLRETYFALGGYPGDYSASVRRAAIEEKQNQ